MFKKIVGYIKSHLGDEFTEVEIEYACKLAQDLIYKARNEDGLRVGDCLLAVSGDRYRVVKLPSGKYTLTRLATGETSALVHNTLSELTLHCNYCDLVLDNY